MIEPIFI